MSYRLLVSPAPERYLRTLDAKTKQRFLLKFNQLVEDPIVHSKPLKGLPGLRGARVGDWRIVFELGDGVIRIDRIAPRGQVYRDL